MNPPKSLRPLLGTRGLPAFSYLHSKALWTHWADNACRATWISSRFGPQISSYCHGQRENQLPTESEQEHRSRRWAPLRNHLIHRFTYVQSMAICNAGLDQPSPSREGYQTPSQDRLFLCGGVKSCLHHSEGSCQPLAAGTSVGSL